MTPEHLPTPPQGAEKPRNELEDLAQKRLDELKDSREHGHEDDPQKRVEAAREKLDRAEVKKEEPAPAAEKGGHEPTIIQRLTPALNYLHTMETLQRQLPAASRAFSRVIHQPVVERASEIMERTVMRPSVTAGATTAAIIMGGVFYVAARTYGFKLSGSEILFALLIGGLTGYALEAAGRFTPRKRH